jgi:hypothetical protein
MLHLKMRCFQISILLARFCFSVQDSSSQEVKFANFLSPQCPGWERCDLAKALSNKELRQPVTLAFEL